MKIEEERCDLSGFSPAWVRHQHVERYRWASRSVAGLRVVAAACGTGYGSAMLVRGGAGRVDGFDFSADAVAQARRACTSPSARFAVASALKLPAADATYDVYISFETIEHVDDDEGFLAEAVRVLRPGGLMLLSTPNRQVLDPGTSINDRPFNRYHIREYVREELEAKLRSRFTSVEWYGQRSFADGYIQWLNQMGRRWPSLAVKVHQARKCAGLPWESPDRHVPTPDTRGAAEILIAACRT
jgi:ubiquinone/menaquinone biosynthesis C-methylase UbiE